MTRYHVTEKVRDLELTKEDAKKLAECFNSFDDSDPWPGGFTGGTPYTAERVLNDLKKSKDVRTLVAVADDKIVGHCNVVASLLDTEAVYVGLLGVNPAYQGRGYGKMLLIEAAETAAQFGKRRIDLHTWGGNLKAVPLYKRVGYNWVPNTQVLMESYIPGIIGSPMFSEFFDRYDWYSSLKVNVRQAMDDIVEEGVGIFKYHFEGENGDSLDVTVDREAKGICGFDMTLDSKRISVSVRPSCHIGYIGTGEVPFRMSVSNCTSEALSFTYQAKGFNGLVVNAEGDTSGTIESSGTVNVTGTYRILEKANPLDRELTPDDKVATQAEWTLSLGKRTIHLYSGLIPVEPVTLNTSPSYPALTPDEKRTIGISMRNNTDSVLKGEMVITPAENPSDVSHTFEFNLKPHEITEFPIDFHAPSNNSSTSLRSTISVFVDEGGSRKQVKRDTLTIPIIGPTGAIAYESLDRSLVLENEHVRFLLGKEPPNNVRQVCNKDTGFISRSWASMPELGYPFPRGGSEWDRKRFEITSSMTDQYAEFRFSAESEERPGLLLTNIYRVYSGREDLEVVTVLENTGSETLTNLGLKIAGWIPFTARKLYIPMDQRVYCLDSIDWSGGRQLPTEPERYTENWAVAELPQDYGMLGFVWAQDDIKDIRIMRLRSIPKVEYQIPDLEPGMKVKRMLIHIVLSQGTWKRIRAMSARLSGRSVPLDAQIPVLPDLEIGFTRPGSHIKEPMSPYMTVDRSNPTRLDIRVKVLHEEPISCDIRIRLPDGLTAGGKREILMHTDNLCIKHPFTQQLTVKADKTNRWLAHNGEVFLTFSNRIERRPLVAIVYDSQAKQSRSIKEFSDKKLHILVSGQYKISTSPDYLANLVHYGEKGRESLFYDTFPEAKPFIWDDKHHSGFRPRMIGDMIWDWQTTLPLETWDICDIDNGPWHGFELTSTFSRTPGLKGVRFKVSYLLLQGTPLVHTRLEAENRSGMWKSFSIGFDGVPYVGKSFQSYFHGVVNHQQIRYEPTENEVSFSVDAGESWGAFQDPKSEAVLGIVSTCRTGPNLVYENSGSAGQSVCFSQKKHLANGDRTSISGYIIATMNVADVVALKRLPVEI